MKKQLSNSSYVFIHRVFKGFADALVRAFVPLIIFKQTGDLKLCLIWVMLNQFITALLFFSLKNVVKKYPITSIIIHIIPLIASQFILTLEIKLNVVIILALIEAVSSLLYYGGINLIFGFMDNDINTAKFESGFHLGKILFLILSTFILGSVKNSLIFVVITASIFYILSVVPLILKYKDLKSAIVIKSSHTIKQSLKQSNWFNFYHLAHGAVYICVGTIFPLYIYSQGLSFTATGFIIVLQEVLYIFGGYVAKFMEKKKKAKPTLLVSALFIMLCIMLILFIKNVYAIYIFNLIISFFFQIVFVIVFSRFCKTQKQQNNLQDAVFYRDMFQSTSRGMVALVLFLTMNMPLIFGIGVVCSGLTGALGIKVMEEKPKKQNKTETNEETKIETPIKIETQIEKKD